MREDPGLRSDPGSGCMGGIWDGGNWERGGGAGFGIDGCWRLGVSACQGSAFPPPTERHPDPPPPGTGPGPRAGPPAPGCGSRPTAGTTASPPFPRMSPHSAP